MNALKMYGLGGLGINIDPNLTMNAAAAADAAGSTQKTGVLDSILNLFGKGADLFNKVAPTIQQFTTGGSGSGFNPNLPAPNIPNQYTPNPTPPTFWQQHGTKVLVGTAVVATGAALVYASRKGKKKK